MKIKWPKVLKAIKCRSIIVLLFLLGAFLATPANSWAQTYEETIDSLVHLLDGMVDQRQKVDRLNEISYAYRRFSLAKMIEYAQQARALATGSHYKQGLAVALKNIGNGHLKTGSPPDTCIYYYKQAIQVAKQVNDYYTQAASLNNIGLLATVQGNHNMGIEHFHEAIVLFDAQVKDESKISLKALMLANLGFSYFGLEEYRKAFTYQKEAIELAEKYDIKFIPSQYMDDLARSAANMGDYEQAEEYYQNAIVLQTETGDYESIIHTFLHFLEMKMEQQKYDEAEDLGQKAVALAAERDFPILLADGLNKLSEIARLTNKVDEAIVYADSALQLSKAIFNLKHEQTAAFQLAQAMAMKGDYFGAFNNLTAHLEITDRIAKDEKSAITVEIEAKYQNEIYEQKVQYLEERQQEQRKNIQLLIGLIIMTLLSSGVISVYLYKRNQSNRIIQNKNQVLEKYITYNLQLENFAYIASHDLKSPLRNVVSFSQLLSRRISDRLNVEEKEYFDFIIAGTKEMSTLIDDLLNYSVVQREKLNIEKIKVDELINSILRRNQPIIEEEKAIVKADLPPVIIDGDPIKLTQLLQNLLQNGLKFHQPGQAPVVEVNFLEQDKEYRFEVKDYGIGIENQYFDKVFMIFKRLHTKKEYEGTGIGLAICKKIVEQHGGKIWIQSQKNESTSFFFTLPKQLS
jgi:signal transduction histidine kinase